MEPCTCVSDPWRSNDRYVSHGAELPAAGWPEFGSAHGTGQGYCWGCALGCIRFVLYRRKCFLGVSSGADVCHGVLLQGLNVRHLVTPQSLLHCADLAFVFHSWNKAGEIENILLEIWVEGRRKVELWPVHVWIVQEAWEIVTLGLEGPDGERTLLLQSGESLQARWNVPVQKVYPDRRSKISVQYKKKMVTIHRMTFVSVI